MNDHYLSLLFLLLPLGCKLPDPIESPGAVRKVSATLYESRLNYDSPLKSRGDSQTVVVSLSPDFVNRYEFSLASTHLDYEAGGNLEQVDLAFAYNNIADWHSGSTFRMGAHVLHADDDTGDRVTDGAITLFGKWTRFEPLDWNYGLGLNVSRFDGGGTDLMVLQASPHFGKYLNDKLAENSVYVETRAHIIHKNDEVLWDSNNLFSLEQRLILARGSFDLAMSGWTGRQLYAVGRDGFVVYSTPDRYEGGVGIDLGFNPSSYQRLSLSFGFSTLQHPGSEETAEVTSLTLGLFTRF